MKEMIRKVHVSEWDWVRSLHHDKTVRQQVQDIIDTVRLNGDDALIRYTQAFDGVMNMTGDMVSIPADVLQTAWESLSSPVQEALTQAAGRIRTFHQRQLPNDIHEHGADGEILGLVWRPLIRVGVYAPGGSAAYASTVLMNVIPAQVAGVQQIVLVSPPSADTGRPHPFVLAAAHLCGVSEVYAVGGAQAIAALAYGTQSIMRVDKIVGPGNQFVASAKQLVMGDVGIDGVAGPSEVFIIADATADPAFVAADMLAQAEHDVAAGAVCITPSQSLADAIEHELVRQLAQLPRADIAAQALVRWGAIVVVDNVEQAVAVVNRCAPEHVELMVNGAAAWLPKVRTAGAVFIGPFSPEPVGDYYAGPNHVLPTHGTARYTSGLTVLTFLRSMTYVEYAKRSLLAHADDVIQLALTEGLSGHAQAIQVRLARGDAG